MFELSNHKKTTAVLAVLLCLPLLLILWCTVQLATGEAEFKGISTVRVVLPDESERTFTEKADVDLYVGMLERAITVPSEMRDLEDETPALLYLDSAMYRLYLSSHLSGCVAENPEGKLLLLGNADAAALIVRDEWEYLYADKRLPTMTVLSGEDSYAILPNGFDWQYRKADGAYYKDTATAVSSEEPLCNLFAQQDNKLQFSVQPSNYSMTVHRVIDGQNSYELPVTSLAGLQFTQDTLVRVDISAKWSQASNAEQYGEATYSFLALYDVPAVVEMVGGDSNGNASVQAGGFVLLRARYTNRQEKLSVSADFETDNLTFYYDEAAQCSYAAIPVSRELSAGSYHLSVDAGQNRQEFTLNVSTQTNDDFLSYKVDAETYETWFAPEKMAEFEQTLSALRASSDGESHLNADLAFGKPCGGEIARKPGATVSFGSDAVTDPKLYTLEGTVYAATSGMAVQAVQSGVCVYAGGLGAAGNTVIIDHGCGIFSYYCHLGDIQIKVGDAVSRSGQIATMAKQATGFTDGKLRMHFLLSVGDIYVNY